MVLTPSTMLELGTRAPAFELPEVGGGTVSSNDFSDRTGLLVMFISQHCPYVQHVRQELARLGRDYADSGLGIVAISSNDIEDYPDDSPENLDRMRRENGFTFPVCFDGSQAVAKAFRASCTPDFFLFDNDRILVYRGQLDESRPGNRKPVTGKDLRTAVDAVLKGEPVEPKQQASVGCNIKWKKGNEPDYF